MTRMVILTVLVSLALCGSAGALSKEQKRNKAAICRVFVRHCREALRVSWCESHYFTWARNGQYLGLFQMGSSERRIYGHGSSPWTQARAAHRYFVASGRDWSPWSCKP